MSRSGRDLILLVEDNDLDAMLLQRVLTRLRPDVKIMRSEDGIDALDALESSRPDLIIMDIRMPRMGGLEALGRIKQDERLRGIPVIMMSTSRDQQDIDRSYDQHANAYVVKSLDAREGQTIENLVRFWLDTAEL